MALRFLGEESQSVPRDRVLASLRLLLAEPKLADLVIADLARWQDWSVIDRLVELFEKAEADNIFVREPIVNYLRACPLPQAAAAIARLEKIDPEAVRRAATLAAFAGAAGGAPGTSATTTPKITAKITVRKAIQEIRQWPDRLLPLRPAPPCQLRPPLRLLLRPLRPRRPSHREYRRCSPTRRPPTTLPASTRRCRGLQPACPTLRLRQAQRPP